MATLFVDKVDPQSGTSLEIGSSGDTITIPSGATIVNSGTQTGFGGVNTPAFEAYASATQTGIGDNIATKMAMNTELFDTNSMYDTGTYRFTPTVAGKYFVYGLLYLESSSGTRADRAVVAIYKNGSSYKQVVAMNVVDNVSSGPSGNVSAVIEFNGSSDYVELYGQLNVYTGTVELDGRTAGGNFGAYKIIE
jgi:hypothetical protein